MMLTRRDLGKLAAAGVPGLAWAQRAKPNQTYISGMQFGLQPFCYHDLPMCRETRPILIQRMVQNGLGMAELHVTWVEPTFNAPDVSAAEAREKVRNCRLTTVADYYRNIKKEFPDRFEYLVRYVGWYSTRCRGERARSAPPHTPAYARFETGLKDLNSARQ